jgi:hypothetical protein
MSAFVNRWLEVKVLIGVEYAPRLVWQAAERQSSSHGSKITAASQSED